MISKPAEPIVRPSREAGAHTDGTYGFFTHFATPASKNPVIEDRSAKNGSTPRPFAVSMRGKRYSNVPVAALVPYTDANGNPRTPNVRRPSPTVYPGTI